MGKLIDQNFLTPSSIKENILAPPSKEIKTLLTMIKLSMGLVKH